MNPYKLAWAILIALFASVIFMALKKDDVKPPPKIDKEVQSIGTDIYIYGYPLITMDITRQVMTNTESVDETKAPMNQFVHLRTFPSTTFRDVTAPNADTLYSIAWVDVAKEPYILHVPEESGRYYLMPMLSIWTEVFADPGTRTTGTNAGDFAITGPGWKGGLPAGIKELKSPTNTVWILGRTYCSGTPDDYNAVHALQDQYTLMPLSSFGKPYTPPQGIVDPSIDMTTPVRNQVNGMDIASFFDRLAKLMISFPPTQEDSAIVAKMAKIGLVPGKEFDLTKLTDEQISSLLDVPALGIEKIMGHAKEAGTLINGWSYTLKTGQYGTDYLQRAYIAAVGLGANIPEDAIYPMASVDSEGEPLSGSMRYTIHFDKTPPVKGFWSLTMYNDQYFFTENKLNRYSIGSRDALKYNDDGSLDLYIQNSSPGKEKESNWLPAPKGKFILMLRLYWPEQALLNETWKPPAVKKEV